MQLQNKTFASSFQTKIKFGINVIDQELAESIILEKKEKAFIVTDKGIVQTGIIDRISNLLTESKINNVVYADVEPNPTADSVMDGLKIYKQENCDLILAVGGGSAIDYAKSLGVVVNNPGHILDYQRGKNTINNKPPLIFAIPTTIGTGSEVTAVSVITNTISQRKVGIVSPFLIPNTAFIDPSLTYSLPRKVVAATGMDALVHAIEAYVSVFANPISDGLALQAIRIISEHLPLTYAHPDNLESRSQVHLASTIAGFAFGTSGLGLVHSCSHPMSALYKVPHGLANAIILPYVIEHNLIANTSKYADLARIFNKKLAYEDDVKAASNLVPELESFLEKLEIPKDFGFLNIEFNSEIIERMAEDAMNDVAPTRSNPRKVYKEDIVDIYKRVLPISNK